MLSSTRIVLRSASSLWASGSLSHICRGEFRRYFLHSNKKSSSSLLPVFWSHLDVAFRFTATRFTATAALPNFSLRSYQQECCDNIMQSFANGVFRCGVSLPTGSGKTVVIGEVIDRVRPQPGQGSRALCVTPSREIALQTCSWIQKNYPGKKVGLECGKHVAEDDCEVVVATIQTLMSKDRMFKFQPEDFKLIVSDEAHGAVSKSFMKMWDYFQCLDGQSKIYVLGVTATLCRHDRKALSKIMDEITYEKSLSDMMDDGYLCNFKLVEVETDEDFSQCLTPKGDDFNLAKVAHLMNTPERNRLVFQTYRHQVIDQGFKSTLIFACTVAHCFALADLFRAQGVDARVVTGQTPKIERDVLIEEFRAGIFPVLINVNVISVGIDIPRCDSIILCRPMRSRTTLVQIVGRGLRLYAGKEICVVIDMANVFDTCGGFLINPTLEGKDLVGRDKTGNGESIYDLKAELDRLIATKPSVVTFNTFKDMEDYLSRFHSYADSSVFDSENVQGVDLAKMTQLNWLHIGNNTFALSGVKSTLRIFPIDKKSVTEALKRKADPLALPYTATNTVTRYNKANKPYFVNVPFAVTEFPSLAHAFKYVDREALKLFPEDRISRSSPWRLKGMTPVQIQFISKTLAKRLEKGNGLFKNREIDQQAFKRLNRGQASDLINLITMKKSNLLLPLTKQIE